MDYEKKYKELIEKIELISHSALTIEQHQIIDTILGELKESKDEKARKALVEMVRDRTGDELWVDYNVHKEEALTWLEKQAQKPTIEMKSAEESLGIDSETYNEIVDECIYGENKPVDKVEPKFKVGDWITNGDYTWKIVEVKPLDYILQSQDGNIVDDSISHVDEQFHSFTIQDAKNGDVIACENGRIGIFKCLNDNLSLDGAWSEEDEHKVKDTIYFLDTAKKHYASTTALDDCIEWLKSLKERLGG